MRLKERRNFAKGLILGGRKVTSVWKYRTSSDVARAEGAALSVLGFERMRGRPHCCESSAQKSLTGAGGIQGLRCLASEKLAIIRTVKGSHLPVKQTLDMLGSPRSTCYRWYDLYVDGGLVALADHSSRPKSVWDRILDVRCDNLIASALEHEAL